MAAENETPLRRLHAIDGADASFLAIDPRAVLETYRCDLSAGDDDPLSWLAIDDRTERCAHGEPARSDCHQANTMTGQQVLPHNCLYPLRHVLVEPD